MLDKLMPNYRPLDEEQVERIAEAMRQGAFCTKEPLREDEELGLVDGRRRLLALVEADVEFTFTVLRGKFDFLRNGN